MPSPKQATHLENRPMTPTYACVDVETTGLAPSKNEIIEIAIVTVKDGQIIDQYEQLIKPNGRMHPFVSRLTGISKDMLKDAPKIDDVIEIIREKIGDHVFVAHNAKFDFDMVNAAMIRCGQPALQNDILDTQDLATILLPSFHSHKLTHIAEHFDLCTKDAHRALSDTLNLAHLLQKFCEIIATTPPIFIQTAAKILTLSNSPLAALFTAHDSLENRQKLTPYTTYLNGFKDTRYSKTPTTPISDPTEIFTNPAGLPSQFENFEARPTQITMSQEIHKAISNNHHTLIEAPTGTGKSLAYLTSAIISAKREKKPVIITTKTKHLQTQLSDDVLPKLCDVGLPHFTYMVIKGKENYIDLKRFDALLKLYLSGPRGQAPAFLGLFYWLLQTKSGELNDLHGSIGSKFSHQVCFNAYSKLDHKGPCFLTSCRQAAKSADILITNHAMYFSDLQTGNQVLPQPSAVIFDEAQGLDDAISNAYTISFTPKSVSDTLESLLESLEDSQEAIRDSIHTATTILADTVAKFSIMHFKDKSQNGQTIQATFVEPTPDNDTALDFIDHLNELMTALKAIHYAISQTDISSDQDMFVQTISTTAQDINQLLTFSPAHASWCEWNEKTAPWFRWLSAPLQAADHFTKHLDEGSPFILTSASLTINDSFDYITKQLGFDRASTPTTTTQLAPIFDYAKAVSVVLPDTTKSQDEQLQEILTNSNGRTLVLFSAFHHLKYTLNVMNGPLQKKGLRILAQRIHGSRENIIQKFRSAATSSIIFGLDSFWEGVDIPGKTLSQVVIAKLPFSSPGDPLHAARMAELESKGGNGFMQYLLPMAVLKFKQGVGRLIRTQSDTGTLAIVDARLTQKSYGRYFRNAIDRWGSEN